MNPIRSTAEILDAMKRRHHLPDVAQVRVKSAPMDVVEGQNGDGYVIRARITTDDCDRDNEILVPAGCNSKEFDKSGSIFFAHEYDKPVAKHVKLIRGENYIDAIAEFPRRPDDFQGDFFPDYIRALVTQGVIRGVSVGFIPEQVRPPNADDMKKWPTVARIVGRWKMLEWSFAPLQSNPEAMVLLALQKRLIVPRVARDVFGVAVADYEPEPVEEPAEEPATKRVISAPVPRPGRIIITHILQPTESKSAAMQRGIRMGLEKARGKIYSDEPEPKNGRNELADRVADEFHKAIHLSPRRR